MKISSSSDPIAVFMHGFSKSRSFSFSSTSCFLVWWQREGSWLVMGSLENQDWWKTPSNGGRQDGWAKLLSYKYVCDPAVSLRSSIVFFIPTTEPHVYLSTKSISVGPFAHCTPSQKQHGLVGGYNRRDLLLCRHEESSPSSINLLLTSSIQSKQLTGWFNRLYL